MPVDPVIRPYQASDWDDIARIHDAARLHELDRQELREAFLTLEQTGAAEGLWDGELWVATLEGEVAGWGAREDDEITWLYVDPSRYRQGIGRALLRHLVARCGDEVSISALDGNEPAIALYRSEGFELASRTSGRLAGNERFAATGVRMVLRKEPSS